MKANFKKFGVLAMFVFTMVQYTYAQVKIGTNPTTIESTNNFEVEASMPDRKLKVNKTTGQLTIKDGTEGMDKVLTSNAEGEASWKAPEVLGIDKTVYIGRQSYTNPGVPYQIITNHISFNDLKDRIVMEPATGSLPGWNATTHQYTIQESGNYRVFAGAKMVGTLPHPQVTIATLYLGPWNALHQYHNISSHVGPLLSVFWEGYLSAGELVNLYVSNNQSTGSPQNIKVSDAFLSIVKLAY